MECVRKWTVYTDMQNAGEIIDDELPYLSVSGG
jgi:hypothetical protein